MLRLKFSHSEKGNRQKTILEITIRQEVCRITQGFAVVELKKEFSFGSLGN